MKIVQINATCGLGSTGKICVAISKLLTENNIENYILYSSKSNGVAAGISCSNSIYIKLQALKSRIFGNYGFNSTNATTKMISILEDLNPDIVHIHNVHGHDVNLELLFSYLKSKNKLVYWTFHDCWAITAYCPYFDMVACDKWKVGCNRCPVYKDYSWFFDFSRQLYKKKKTLFSDINLTIITPSRWLAEIVSYSFLRNCPVHVINNGIDLEVFKERKGNFKDKYSIPHEKKVVLGVAFDWGMRKGLDVFIELAKRLDNKKYQVVLVGTNSTIDAQLPEQIISIHRTNKTEELVSIYSEADVFLNPTREENFPTVNLEALACGTPVITFQTGGSPEIVDGTCGSVVPRDDIDEMEKEVVRVCTFLPFSKENCRKRAMQFNKEEKFGEYLELYKKGYYDRITKSGIRDI